MRKNDWTEEKAVTCIKNLFLKNKLNHSIATNDKTEFIDGYVYIENEANKMLGLDTRKIEIQVKGRTSKVKGVTIKETFLNYCKTNIVPVVLFFVSINEHEESELIYFKYIDSNLIESVQDSRYIKFTDKDIITSNTLVQHLQNIQNVHLNKIISRFNTCKTNIKNQEIYHFMNDVIKRVNGFLYTVLNKYMQTNFKNLQRFGIVYYLSSPDVITYSIIPIYQGSLYNNIIEVNDVIEVNDKKEMFKLRLSKMCTMYDVEFNDEFCYKLIKKILKDTIIPSILNVRTFSKINKDIAKRSLIYYLNIILNREKNTVNLDKYNSEIKKMLTSNEIKYSKHIIEDIINTNINRIEDKLKRDIEFAKQHESSRNFVFYSECEDNKFTVDVVDDEYIVKTTRESIYYLLKELLNFINDGEILDISEYKHIFGQFASQDDLNYYIKLKYDCVCEFCNLYTNVQSRKYIWNGHFDKENSMCLSNGTEYVQVYYSNKWESKNDKSIINSISYTNADDFDKGMIRARSQISAFSRTNLDGEILVKEIYDEIISILFDNVETYY